MAWGISAATVLGLLAPLAPSFPVLLGLRMLEGMALGGIPAIAIAYLNEEINQAHAALAAGTYVAGTTLGGLGRQARGRSGGRAVGLAGRSIGRVRDGDVRRRAIPDAGAAGAEFTAGPPAASGAPSPTLAGHGRNPGCWPSTSRHSC